jgi:hypothetical protein
VVETVSAGRVDPLVFIGGVPRSGTTLLRNILAAHSSIAIPTESYWMYEVLERLNREGRLDDLPYAWELMRAHRVFPPDLDTDLTARAIEDRPPSDVVDLIRAVFSTHALSKEKSMSGDKTPRNVDSFVWLHEMFPHSRLVHLIRDPREVCMSLSLQHFTRFGLPGAADNWTGSMVKLRAAMRALGAEIYEVRYEDLVSHPEREIRNVCDFLGVEFEPQMLTAYSDNGRPRIAHVARAWTPIEEGLRNWRDELSRTDLAVIEATARREMKHLGYKPTLRFPYRPSALWRIFKFRAERWLYWRLRRRFNLAQTTLPERASIPPARIPITPDDVASASRS